MALYVIGDTHFSDGVGKPMDVFGGPWQGSRQKLLDGFGNTLEDGDTLVLCGDFSWGMNLEQTLADFRLLTAFPGRKLMIKGNHDYWWETLSKMRKFLGQHGLDDIDFIHNNCFFYGETALCGSRGWFIDKDDQIPDDKIYLREVIRLEASLAEARKQSPGCEIIAFLHYPPVFTGFEAAELTSLLRKYGVKRCFYGHLHGYAIGGAFCGERDGVYYSLISADAVGFKPVKIMQ